MRGLGGNSTIAKKLVDYFRVFWTSNYRLIFLALEIFCIRTISVCFANAWVIQIEIKMALSFTNHVRAMLGCPKTPTSSHLSEIQCSVLN